MEINGEEKHCHGQTSGRREGDGGNIAHLPPSHYPSPDGIGSPAAQTSGYDNSFSGQVGNALTLEQGQKAAELTSLYALARIH